MAGTTYKKILLLRGTPGYGNLVSCINSVVRFATARNDNNFLRRALRVAVADNLNHKQVNVYKFPALFV